MCISVIYVEITDLTTNCYPFTSDTTHHVWQQRRACALHMRIIEFHVAIIM